MLEFENYRSNSWHSSSNHTLEGNRPLLDASEHNPYLKKSAASKKKSHIAAGRNTKAKASNIHGGDEGAGENRGSMKKKRGTVVHEEEEAMDFIKMSDIKASNPLSIENTKRTESNLMEKIKVSEGTFQASMRQASTHFKAVESIKGLRGLHIGAAQ